MDGDLNIVQWPEVCFSVPAESLGSGPLGLKSSEDDHLPLSHVDFPEWQDEGFSTLANRCGCGECCS